MKTLFQKALQTEMHSRFIARSDDLNRDLTDKEVISEAKYLIDTIPFSGSYEGKDLHRVIQQLKRLLK